MFSIMFYDVMIKMDGKVSTSLEDEYFLFSRYTFYEAQSTVFRGAMIWQTSVLCFMRHLDHGWDVEFMKSSEATWSFREDEVQTDTMHGFRLNVCVNLSLCVRTGKAMNMLCFLCKVNCFFFWICQHLFLTVL